MARPTQQHRRRYASTAVLATEAPRFWPVSPSRRGRNGVTHSTRGESPMARLLAFPSRSRLAGVAVLAVLIAGAAYGASTSVAAPRAAQATTIRVVDYYAVEPDKTIVGNVLNTCGKSVGVKINRDAIPGANLI